jgi:hypothetical protein
MLQWHFGGDASVVCRGGAKMKRHFRRFSGFLLRSAM